MPSPLHPGDGVALATLTDLTYWYPSASAPAIEHVTLEVDAGLTVVTGPSGGGKSTLLRVFNGLVPHFHGGRISGSAEVAGQDIITTPTRKLARTVGFVFQDPELQTVYTTVDREVAFGLENMAVPAREIPGHVHEALAAAGAEHLAGRTVRTLSGGERQRVAIASALALRPRLIVLDEPTSQLDPEGAAMVFDAVDLLIQSGRAAVISSHRPVKSAQSVFTVPTAWLPPQPAHITPRTSPLGPQAWSLHKVSAGFGDRIVLDNVSLSGRQGEVVVLNGPNGGGKTTLLRLIAGSLAPLEGKVERREGRIAYLPQNPTALLHRPTLREEVSLTLDRSKESEPPETILERLGLLALAQAYPRDLSTGERQRSALAAVLPGHPALVLLDEPTRGMDTAARHALVRLIGDLRDGGSAIVVATHDKELAEAIGDRTITVAEGKTCPAPLRGGTALRASAKQGGGR